MEELFSSHTFFHFSRGENRSGLLRWPWRGVPKSLVPTVLSRAVHPFCCQPSLLVLTFPCFLKSISVPFPSYVLWAGTVGNSAC